VRRADVVLVTSVLVIAGVRLYREGLADVLRQRFEIAGAASDVAEAMPILGGRAPDIVLLDMATPESTRAVCEIVEVAPSTKVVALAVPEVEHDVVACAEAGVAGYVTRDATIDEVVASIESAARGEVVCSPRIAATLLRRVRLLSSRQAQARPASRLTSRELEIAELLQQGLSNKEIATRLFIEVATVKNHVHNILEKLHVHHRSEVSAAVQSAALGGELDPLRSGATRI
jgi:two-component system nitrate/nitrite response regulator NarL